MQKLLKSNRLLLILITKHRTIVFEPKKNKIHLTCVCLKLLFVLKRFKISCDALH